MAQPDILTLHALANPQKPGAIEDRPDGTVRSWTYDELNRQANRLANVMLGLGVGPRDKVVWWGPNSLGVVAIGHAARKIKATAVPLNYRLSPEEASYVVGNSDAVLVYVDAEYAELFSKIRGEIPQVRNVLTFDGPAGPDMLDADALAAEAGDAEPETASETEAETMIYTSGTTGKPKGAVRSGVGDPEQLGALLMRIGYQPDDVYLTTGPLYHSGPGGFMAIAYALGNTCVIQRRFDPEDWLRLLEKYRVSSTFSAPTPIRMICNLDPGVKARYDRSTMRVMIANAAPWSFALKQAYLEDFPENSLWEVYGSTELGVNCLLAPEDQRRKPGSCGQAAPGVEIRLFDADGNVVTEPNVPGELYVRSKSSFEEYYKAEEQFESGRREGFHTVGDVAYVDEEGYYYICDRKNDMIISGGMNVYPAEIEAALEHHPKIFDVAVFGIPDEQWGEKVHASIVLQPNETLSEDQILSFARERLAGYKLPRSIQFMDELPRTGSGKLLKRQLREPYWKGRDSRVL
jgi:fatty-acyl-CoA synthase/long-chain acyl-CoA synthetase